MTDYLLGDLRTGRRLVPLQVTDGPWGCELDGPGTVSATVSLLDDATRALEPRNAATVGKAFLAVVENDVIMNAGPVWTHKYVKDDGKLTLNASGMWSYFDHRVLLPLLAATVGPLDPRSNTSLSGLSLGTIAKRLVQQAQTHTGGDVPVVFQDDELGTSERNYLGSDLKLIGDELVNITGVDGGPDIEFTPEWTEDRLGIRWRLRTGTAAQPQLAGPSVHVWDYSVPRPSIRGLEVDVDGSKLVGRAWASGGRSNDKALFSQFSTPTLTDQGYPLLEIVDSSHQTVTRQATLDGYAREAARTGSKPREFWSFEVQADQVPRVGDYRPGDWCRVLIANDPYIPDGAYLRRITEISGDEKGRWIKVTTGEVYSLTG